MDEAGTPFCITVDFEGLADQTVTLRDRDSMEQIRVSIDKIDQAIRDKVKNWKSE
jgi:glycyl-tRNA synthetase